MKKKLFKKAMMITFSFMLVLLSGAAGSTTTTDESVIEPAGFNCTITIPLGEHSEETELIRSFRDNVLSQTPEGREIIRLYYQLNPVMVKMMEEDEEFKQWVKEKIEEILPLIREEVE